jgi:hypothetical protein
MVDGGARSAVPMVHTDCSAVVASQSLRLDENGTWLALALGGAGLLRR